MKSKHPSIVSPQECQGASSESACGASLHAEFLHGVDHFLLKLLQGAGFAQVQSFAGCILCQILEVECSFTVGEKLDCGRFAALAKGISQSKEGGVFSELPIHRGGMTD